MFKCALQLRGDIWRYHVKAPYAAPRGGGGGTHQSFIRGGSAPRSKPLPFYIPFLIEKVPLSYTFHKTLYPFHIPTEQLLLIFTLEKPFKTLGWISRWVRLFELFRESHLIPKWQFSQPFSILHLVKSLPFHIPPAWKWHPFRAEPPRIVHYRVPPPPPSPGCSRHQPTGDLNLPTPPMK